MIVWEQIYDKTFDKLTIRVLKKIKRKKIPALFQTNAATNCQMK